MPTIIDNIKVKLMQKMLSEMTNNVDLWTAAFGRMTTTAFLSNVYSAAKFGEVISIDEHYGGYDDFSVLDTLSDRFTNDDGKEILGASNLQSTSFSSNVMHECFVIDVNQLIKNRPRKERETVEEYAKLAADYITDLIDVLIHTSPSGKQHSMYSNPAPEMIVCRVTDSNCPAYSLAQIYTSGVNDFGNDSPMKFGIKQTEKFLEDDLDYTKYSDISMWSSESYSVATHYNHHNKMNSFYTEYLVELNKQIYDYIMLSEG